MKSKNIMALLAAMLLLLSCVGCGTGHDDPVSGPDPTDAARTTENEVSDMRTDGTTAVTAGSTSAAPTKTGGATKTTAGKTAARIDVNVQKRIDPLTAEDDALMQKNPDRGWRLEMSPKIGYIATAKDVRAEVKAVIDGYTDESDRAGEKPTLTQLYFYLSEYIDRDISEKCLNAMQIYMDELRARGFKVLLRFAYSANMDDAADNADQATMLRHIEQLKPFVRKNKDMVHVLQIGFVGAWGEWHSQHIEVDRALIIQKVCEELATPQMYLQARLPTYKDLLPKSSAAYARIGINNDAFFGASKTKQSGGFAVGSAMWEQCTAQAATAPQDGETYWNYACIDYDWWADPREAVREFYDHRFTSFSIKHSYLDAQNAENTFKKWKNAEVTESWLKEQQIIYAPSWFLDKNGKPVKRSFYELIRDHLGYRVELQSVSVKGTAKPGARIDVEVPLINYGMAAAFNMESGFAILDSGNKVVSTVACGTPNTWYNRSATDPKSTAVLTHTLRAQLTLPKTGGHYKLAFFLKNGVDAYARPANRLETANGFAILHEFDI